MAASGRQAQHVTVQQVMVQQARAQHLTVQQVTVQQVRASDFLATDSF
jgi:hypothetical protein